MRKYVGEEELNTKQDKTTKVSSFTSLQNLNDNYEYRLTDVDALTFTYPPTDFEVWIKISTKTSGTITINFPSDTKWLGPQPVFSNNQIWEISIKDKIAAAWRIQ